MRRWLFSAAAQGFSGNRPELVYHLILLGSASDRVPTRIAGEQVMSRRDLRVPSGISRSQASAPDWRFIHTFHFDAHAHSGFSMRYTETQRKIPGSRTSEETDRRRGGVFKLENQLRMVGFLWWDASLLQPDQALAGLIENRDSNVGNANLRQRRIRYDLPCGGEPTIPLLLFPLPMSRYPLRNTA